MIRLRRSAATAGRAALFTFGTLLLLSSPAAAQIEIGGGLVWNGGYDAGRATATETANSSTGGAPITLFTTRSRVAAVAGLDTRAAFYFGSRLAAEGVFQFSQPKLRVDTGDDFENAADVDVVGSTSTYLLGGSLVYHFGTGQVVPFVLGGAGYLRLLDEDKAEVITGNELHAGGGVKLWFDRRRQGLGVRLEAQASIRSKSPGFEDTRRILPAVSAGLLYRF